MSPQSEVGASAKAFEQDLSPHFVMCIATVPEWLPESTSFSPELGLRLGPHEPLKFAVSRKPWYRPVKRFLIVSTLVSQIETLRTDY